MLSLCLSLSRSLSRSLYVYIYIYAYVLQLYIVAEVRTLCASTAGCDMEPSARQEALLRHAESGLQGA